MKTFDANIIVCADPDDDFDTLGEVGFKLQMGITLAPGTREPFQGWNFDVKTLSGNSSHLTKSRSSSTSSQSSSEGLWALAAGSRPQRL